MSDKDSNGCLQFGHLLDHLARKAALLGLHAAWVPTFAHVRGDEVEVKP
jgi:hypothetical protein